jgi:NitT/TauT family transport system ATP-binding protein
MTETTHPRSAHRNGHEGSLYRAAGVGVTFDTSEGPLEVLRDIDLDVRAGEIVAIVGRSGTGKTTLLRALGAQIRPTTGSVYLSDVELDKPTSRAITVFQDYGNALLPWRTVARNVGLGLEGRLPKSERQARVQEALELVHLGNSGDEYPWRLSGGMQQRVQIARALAMKPEVLLMDEPFGALDAFTKAALQDELLKVHAESGTTIVFITHDIEEAIYLSDRVCVISGSSGAGLPGTLSMEVPTGLARPRDQISTRALPEYLALRQRLLLALHGVHENEPER